MSTDYYDLNIKALFKIIFLLFYAFLLFKFFNKLYLFI